MKFVVLCALLALALVDCSSAQSHNFTWGVREVGDRQLFRDIITKKSSFLQVVTKDVEFRAPARITFVKVIDQYTNGKGGYASLLKGGAGYSDVTIHLKSQRGHGFNFIVEIFGA